ncbi:Lrp/AsnC family transcriptional regulator [Mycolicibacterium komossense]|uniref:Lrp/AsnC family transcriptional regulator n=1 Tax=Mycolicibacterium komossense TaxID=1779 RepID=A0ABT3CFX0_9MYCO|nr:Lrp/AsnC family transcriptional regulator [Mycolicibacterium komossense]MCV7228136.1 Lrp/AsnC family transcriptional regulator [Mycolicibacterium komossense]
MAQQLDKLDLDVLRLMVEDARAGVREYARRLSVARGTVQSRIDRFVRSGIITSYQPQMQPTALGYSILAFVHVHIAQAMMDATCIELAEIPEVLEVNSVAGEGDLLCRVVARDHDDFEHVLQTVISCKGVLRTRSELVLSRRIPPRITPLLEKIRTQVG